MVPGSGGVATMQRIPLSKCLIFLLSLCSDGPRLRGRGYDAADTVTRCGTLRGGASLRQRQTVPPNTQAETGASTARSRGKDPQRKKGKTVLHNL